MFHIPKMCAFSTVVSRVKCRPVYFKNIFHCELAIEVVLWRECLEEGKRLYSLNGEVISPDPCGLVEHHSAKQKVDSSIPSQGMCLGCGFGSWSGFIQEETEPCFSHTLMFLSLTFSFPSLFKKTKPKNFDIIFLQMRSHQMNCNT